MPSPFPGMNPYLEDPGLWPDVHQELISAARAVLNPLIVPKYVARIEQRVYVSEEDDPGRRVLVPDLRIDERPGRAANLPANIGAAAVAEPIVVPELLDDEIHESRIEIIDRAHQGVVTVIEFLSPSNKIAGAKGRVSFVAKRREVLDASTHWVEIDLLRAGSPTLAYRHHVRPHEYAVFVAKDRGVEGRLRHLWPIRLDERLPVIPIPLKPEDADAPLDLQAVLEAAYDRAGYDYQIDYRAEPVPPLADDWAAWTDRLLRAKGLRPAS